MSTTTRTERPLPLGDLAELMTANRDAINGALTAHRHPTRIALYARISDDPDDTRDGTDEQITDQRSYALRHLPGVPVVAEYVDDDRSAFNANVRRDGFENLLRDAAAGIFDCVLIRDTDRLYRRLEELPRIVRELVPHAQVVALMEGEVDLTTAAGILRAQMLGAVAEHESRRKGERVAANARHRAQNGRMTASVRPFGWAWRQPCDGIPTAAGGECEHAKPHPPAQRPRQGSRAGLVPHPTESPAVAEVYAMVADGTSLRQATRWLIDQGFSGVRGATLRPEQVRGVLQMPRNAGLVAHQGRLVAEAKDGHKIVDVDLWQQVQLILGDETRRTSPGRPANTALSGIATCGRCGGPMNASNKHSAGKRLPEGAEGPRGGKRAKGPTTPIYLCSRHQHLTKARRIVDDAVLTSVGQLVIEYAPRLAQEATTDAGPAESLARREVARLREQIKGYQRQAAQMDPEDLVAILNRLRADLVEVEQRTAVVAQRPGMVRLTASEDLDAAWQALVEDENRDPLRQVIRELVENVTIHPGRGPVDQAVEITWQEWVRKAIA